jgi:uncharacterized protein with HEPN domain
MAVSQQERDYVRLLQMRDEAYHALAFIRGETRSSLDSDTLLTHALEMSLRIIGVIASRMTQTFRDANPQIAWQQYIDVSDHIIEEYRAVDLDRVWNTAYVSIPSLIAELQKLLPPEASDEMDET